MAEAIFSLLTLISLVFVQVLNAIDIKKLKDKINDNE